MTIQTLNESVAAEIRSELGRQGMRQGELAVQLGWSATYLSRRLNGQVDFSTTDIGQISEALGVPLTLRVAFPRPGSE